MHWRGSVAVFQKLRADHARKVAESARVGQDAGPVACSSPRRGGMAARLAAVQRIPH
jgi:hypothetical protein